MGQSAQILPGSTMRSMTSDLRSHRECPSTTLRVVPLPRWGRIRNTILPGTGRGTMRSMVEGYAQRLLTLAVWGRI